MYSVCVCVCIDIYSGNGGKGADVEPIATIFI
jgi:hypothetical protein